MTDSIQDYADDLISERGEDEPILPQKVNQAEIPYQNDATRRQKRINFIVATIALFFSNTRFAVVSPSLWNYIKAVSCFSEQIKRKKTGGSLTFYGIVVCAFSVGQIIGAPLLGYWANKRAAKEPIICSLIVITIAGVVYSASSNPWLILGSRLLQGIGSGHNAVIQSYVAQSSSMAGRARSLANLNLFGTLGFAAGPGFGAMLSFLHIKCGNIEILPYSSAGYFCTLTSVVVFVLVLGFFKDEKNAKGNFLHAEEVTPKVKLSVEKKVILGLLIFMCFNQFNELAVYDTLATPITKDHYHWKIFENSMLWVCISLITLLSFLSVNALSKFRFMTDSFILTFNLILQTVGCAIIVQPDSSPLPLWRFLIGTAGISWGFPVTQIYTVSTFSKILGTKKQGVWMGLLTAGSACARMVGPLWSTATYDHFHMYLIFAILAGLLLINTILCILLYSCGYISRNMPQPVTIK